MEISKNRALPRLTRLQGKEEYFSSLLDLYGIEWLYRPVNFALQTAPDGFMIEGFAPDFYLLEQDMYLQVSGSRRKLAMLKEIYPHIHIERVHPRNFLKLIKSLI